MQAARGAVSGLREKGKSFVKPKYADQLLGSGLEEQIRRATAKSLPGPDLASNRRVGPSVFSATSGLLQALQLTLPFVADRGVHQHGTEPVQRTRKYRHSCVIELQRVFFLSGRA